ncbi:MAG: hypothetical protein AAF449_00715 [Myxococcota bacterium]
MTGCVMVGCATTGCTTIGPAASSSPVDVSEQRFELKRSKLQSARNGIGSRSAEDLEATSWALRGAYARRPA